MECSIWPLHYEKFYLGSLEVRVLLLLVIEEKLTSMNAKKGHSIVQYQSSPTGDRQANVTSCAALKQYSPENPTGVLKEWRSESAFECSMPPYLRNMVSNICHKVTIVVSKSPILHSRV